jgi:hypothetical protein
VRPRIVIATVVLLVIVIRQLFVHPPSTIILGVCAGLAALAIVLAVYLRNMGSTLVVTADDITFTRRHRRGKGPPLSRSSSAPPAAC